VTDQNLTPGPDDTEGHFRRDVDDAGTDDDTEGHFRR
jgi:hypothetical protein